jgi:hypothetical protein
MPRESEFLAKSVWLNIGLLEKLESAGIESEFDIGQVDDFIKGMLSDVEELKGVHEALAEIFEYFKSEHDGSSKMSTRLRFRLLLIKAAFAASEVRGIYCPTDALIDPICCVVLKFPDERVNIEFAMDGKTTICFVDGSSLYDATVDAVEVLYPSELGLFLRRLRLIGL